MEFPLIFEPQERHAIISAQASPVSGLWCTALAEISEGSLVRIVSNHRGHESDSRLPPHQARRSALAAFEPNENSKRGLFGTHRQREAWRTTVAIATQKREHAPQAHA